MPMSALGKVLHPRSGRLVRELSAAVRNRGTVPLHRQVNAWRHGFYAETTRLYDFDRYGYDAYVSDYTRATALASLNEHRYVLDDKAVAYLWLREMGVPTPRIHGVVHDGAFTWLGRQPPHEGLPDLLQRSGRLVVKSRSGSGGSGFALLQWRNGTACVDGREVADLVGALPAGSLVVSEFADQHGAIADIYPHTTNSMRVITVKGARSSEPVVAFASHRFGTDSSAPIDNFGAGGLSVGIDMATGTLERAMHRRLGPGGSGRRDVRGVEWLERHPDTGRQIEGVVVPHWDEIVQGITLAAGALPGCRYVGWDVVVTPTSFTVLEGNNRGDVVVQMHAPLLLDEHVREAFADVRRRRGLFTR